MGGEIVEAQGVVRIYGSGSASVHALRGVNLVVPPGVLVTIQGRSGSGKTTLLNMLGGLDRPNSGSVRFAGQDMTRLSDSALSRLRRHSIGFVFQSFSLLPTFSAVENVDLALRLAGVGSRERQDRAKDLLRLVGLEAKLKHRPFELSGGEQQRVVIARALANRPKLLLADEPTGQLDSATGRAILKLFRTVVDQDGITAIIATHDPAAIETADLGYQIQDGQLLAREGS